MKKILGLDLGTNSIGWALVNEDETGNGNSSIIKLGSRIIHFDTFVKSDSGAESKDPVKDFNSGKGLSPNAGRSKAHGMRIRLQRYKLRRSHLINTLRKHNIINEEAVLCENGKNTTLQTYALRAKAAENEITLEEFARVLQMINKKRGYKSNRKEMQEEDDAKQTDYMKGINSRSDVLKEEGLTVGQWMYLSLTANPHKSLKNQVFYRQDYLDEFERVWSVQAQHHPELTDELKEEIRDIVIFFQRRLKSKKSLISDCPFESRMKEVAIGEKTVLRSCGCKVAPKSSPLFQEFRIWQNINNIMLTDFITHTTEPLSQQDKDTLFRELSFHEKMTKKQVLKLLNRSEREYDINFDEIQGNRSQTKLLKALQKIFELSGHGEYKFAKMKTTDILSIAEPLLEHLGVSTEILHFDSSLEGKALEQQPSYQLWHLLYSYEADDSRSGNEKLLAKLQSKFGFAEEYGKVLANIAFELDYAGLSAKAIRKLLPHMKQGLRYDEACEAVGYNHSNSVTREENENRELQDYLTLIPRNTLRNPVVEKILNQMVNVVNTVIKQYGKPDEIRIELARELKKNSKQRQKMTEDINKQAKKHEDITKLLQGEFGILNPTRNDIIRYKLYLELKENGYKTLYSDTYIAPSEIFSAKFDIEHIIPKAKLFNDSFSNKTLEARDANIAKSDKTAMDYVATKGENAVSEYKARVEALFKKGEISKSKRDFLLMKEANIPSDFLNRDLAESQYIARQAISMLKEVVRTVSSTTGSVTDRLREDWGLVDVMKELNWDKYDRLGLTETRTDKEGRKIRHIKDWTKRNDHRHHAMDALVIAFTKPAFIQYLNNLAARYDRSESGTVTTAEPLAASIRGIQQKELEVRDGRLRFKAPMDLRLFRKEAKRHLAEIFVSLKSKGKVATKSQNKTKGHVQETLTPRGQLHNETVYGKSLRTVITLVKVDGKMTAERIAAVTSPVYREALQKRLDQFNGDAKKAFTGKNSPEKNPVWIDEQKQLAVPEKVKIRTFEEIFTIRKDITPETFKNATKKNMSIFDKVIDSKIRQILIERFVEFNYDPKPAFSNLDENPIWLNREKGIAIKSVKLKGVNETVSLHDKRDHLGNFILDENGRKQPNDFVSTSNNHHVAIFVDEKGNLQEHIVSLFEAVEQKRQGHPVIDKEYNHHLGWRFLFSMKINEYLVFSNEETGFNPQETDFNNPENWQEISRNLFRVQALSTGDYLFRHHLETTTNRDAKLRDITWKRITNINLLKNVVKVRINHIGQIVQIGE